MVPEEAKTDPAYWAHIWTPKIPRRDKDTSTLPPSDLAFLPPPPHHSPFAWPTVGGLRLSKSKLPVLMPEWPVLIACARARACIVCEGERGGER